ncbi:MAG: dephospho-CoA kinase [Calditrichaeota bacterium]|nr:dephospho-CoA kinase [Calditrichota bacterium]MCB9391083.1 dephospho-CoA kinase [Calditrichota bacterium]
MKKLSVALTGGIGVGKSTVGEMLAGLGADVVSGDELGREVLEQDSIVQQELIRVLGPDIQDEAGTFNRALIARRVFAESSLTTWLRALTFPGIHKRWRARLDSSPRQVVVFDAALIFEWEIEIEFDLILVVSAPYSELTRRSQGRFTEEDIARRSTAQLNVEKKIQNANFHIVNDQDKLSLSLKVQTFWNTQILPRIA